MLTAGPIVGEPGAASAAARRRLLSLPLEPLFVADWEKVLMMHLEVDANGLQHVIPFELDLWHGRAFVSLVAFTMRGMRPAFGGQMAAWLFRPIASHEFLNVRTYVRHGGEPGIHFMAEWLSNRIATRLGPRVFGLPYRHGCNQYQHGLNSRGWSGTVRDTGTGAQLRYRTGPLDGLAFAPCEAGSLDEWLMERYTAFNCARSRGRFFRVWHPPWPQLPVEAEISDKTLLTDNWPFLADARLVGANVSPGLCNVQMGRPHRCATRTISASEITAVR